MEPLSILLLFLFPCPLKNYGIGILALNYFAGDILMKRTRVIPIKREHKNVLLSSPDARCSVLEIDEPAKMRQAGIYK